MNELQKARVKTVFKYTWPLYLVSAVVIAFGMNFLFGITHKMPKYQQMTIFISGEMKNDEKLKTDILEKYKGNELKSFTSICSNPENNEYFSKLTVPGYSTADILIIPDKVMQTLAASYFAANITDEMYHEYFEGYTLYEQSGINYGIVLDKEKIQDYFYPVDDTCYLFLNGSSVNLGSYTSKDAVKEHDNALKIVQDWGKHV